MRSDTVANIHFVNLLFLHDYIVKVNDNNIRGVSQEKYRHCVSANQSESKKKEK